MPNAKKRRNWLWRLDPRTTFFPLCKAMTQSPPAPSAEPPAWQRTLSESLSASTKANEKRKATVWILDRPSFVSSDRAKNNKQKIRAMSRVWKEVELLDTQRLVNHLRLKISWASNLQVQKSWTFCWRVKPRCDHPQREIAARFFIFTNPSSKEIRISYYGTSSPYFCLPRDKILILFYGAFPSTSPYDFGVWGYLWMIIFAIILSSC